MKTPVTLSIFLALIFSAGSLIAQPNITVQPQSRTNNVGDNAQFSVTATGTGTLTYQWQSNSVNIAGAISNTLNVLITDTNKAGNYRVLVSDTSNLTNTSSTAVLSLPYGDRIKIAQWDFNSNPPDTSATTGSLLPSFGAGTYATVSTPAVDFVAGTVSDPAPSDNTCWRGTTWGNSTSANKSKGMQFSVSSVNYKDIVVTFEGRGQTSASRYLRLQYTTNGTDWVDHSVFELTGSSTYKSSDLSAFVNANNNPQFAFRILPEWQSTAINSGTAGFVGISATYAGSGNLVFELITILGAVYTPPDTQPQIATQPQSQTNYIGADVTFNVVATGGHLTYQWRFEGNDVPGATNSSFVLNDIVTTNEGNYSVFITNSVSSLTSQLAYLSILVPPPPGDRYWSGDGAILGGLGTWDTTSQRWGTSAAGPFGLAWNNANVDTAFFNVPAGTVTIGESITVNKINVVGNANYTFSGANRLTFTNDSAFDCTSVASSAAVTFTCPLGADVLTKTGAGRMHLNNTGNNVNKFVATAGIFSVQNGSSLGGTPATLVPDRITLDGAGLGFEGVAPSLSATRGMTLGPGGGKLAVRSGGVVLTINAPITGPGGMTFPGFNAFHGSGIYGAAETFVFTNPNNDYQGGTTVSVGTLRCGAAEVLPNSTTLTLSGSSIANVNGFTETVGNVIVNGSNARLQDTVGGGLLIATNYDMRQGGVQTAVLGGNANLTKTTANMVSLNAANTYTGDTILKNGTIALNAVGRFGNGAGTLYLDGSEGTIAIELSDTRTQANTLTNPVVFAAANVTIQSAAAVTNDIIFRHSGSWTNSGGTLYLWNTSPTYSFDALLSGAFDFTAPITTGPGATVRLTSYNPQGSDQIYSGTISGPGSLRRAASGAGGRTILTADNSYSGGTLVEAGTLLVNNTSGSGTGTGGVTVNGGVLGGTGSIAGNVVVASGGSIAAGASAGNLTLQSGLDLSGGGTNVWELAALKDNATGTGGTDFDVLTLTAGELVLGGSSTLVLQFTGSASAPNSANPFWQAVRTWTVVALSGGLNTTNLAFASIANGTYNAGTFTNSVDGSGNILLTFTPAVPAAPHITSQPQSRTNIAGTTATFSVVATGSDPLTYEWYRIDAPFTPIGGATNSTFTIVNVQPANASDYFARAYNGLGNDTSQTAKLTVAPRPQIQTPAVSGGNVTLNWTAVPGTAYQVRYNTNLTTTNWFVLTNIVATGTTITVTDHPPVGSLQRYYRLLIQ